MEVKDGEFSSSRVLVPSPALGGEWIGEPEGGNWSREKTSGSRVPRSQTRGDLLLDCRGGSRTGKGT